MRSATLGIALFGVVAGLSHAGTARACGASPEPVYVVDTVGPTSGDTPLNTPLFVHLREAPTATPDQLMFPTLTLIQEGADEPVAVRSFGAASEQVWLPVEPLEPETTYEAHFNLGYEGVPDTIWNFTTGDELQPALSLAGELEVTLEQGTRTDWQCPQNGCPCGCTDTELAAACSKVETPVTNARVKVPRAVGGFSKRYGQVTLTDDKPYPGGNVSVSEYVDLDDPELVDVLIPLPEEETPYRPCFLFEASDARQDRASVEALCLEELFPAPAANPSAGTGGSSGAPLGHDDLANDQPRPSNTSEGCSMSRASSSAGAWFAILGLLSVVQRRRRRHQAHESRT